MPEGDTVYRAAKTLNDALAGSVLTRCDIRVPRFATVDLTGEVVHSVASRGKHLLMRIGEQTIHSHLKMEGTWQLYRHGSRWRRPTHQLRALLETRDWVAAGFSLGLLEVLPTAQEERVVGYLGPDLLGADWDADEAERRLRQSPERMISAALLDQRVMAGIGNVYSNELCFLRGVLPTRPVGDVPALRSLIDLAHRLLLANRDRSRRATTGNLRGAPLWVYGRGGLPCLRCGTTVLGATVGESPLTARSTFWCPHCQT